jgi:hypothetical protein
MEFEEHIIEGQRRRLGRDIYRATLEQAQSTENAEAQSKEVNARETTWELAKKVQAKLVEKGVKPDARVLQAHALEKHGRKTDRIRLELPKAHTITLGAAHKLSRDRHVNNNNIEAWNMTFDDAPEFHMYLGTDGALYRVHDMTSEDRQRGVQIPQRVFQPGSEMASLELYEQAQVALASLVVQHNLQWP